MDPPPRTPTPPASEEVFEAVSKTPQQVVPEQEVTEKNISEFSLKFDLFGLDLRSVNTVETRKTSYSTRATAKKNSSAKRNDSVIDAEILDESNEPAEGGAHQRVRRAYLYGERGNSSMGYLA
jgi:hypothetical protein